MIRQYLRGSPGRRAQAEVLGYTLIFGILVAGSLLILGLGATAIDDAERGLSDDRAEKALTQFDSKAGLVALGDADSQRVNFATEAGEKYRVNENEGWMRITVENRTTGEEWEDPLMNATLGAVEYENGDTKMAYQGGGVWRTTDSGGQMISPPEFHYRNGTLTLPTVTVRGEGTLGSGVSISQGGEQKKFPTAEDNRKNPLDNHLVTLAVQSEYYRGWGQYFEKRTDGEVKYDDDAEIAVLVLKTPVGEKVVENAVGATSADGDFIIAGNDDRTDSYNSTEGSYSDTQGADGNITVAGDFDISGGSEVLGDVETGGQFECSGNSRVDGRVYWTESFESKGSCDTGPDTEIAGVEGEEPINNLVNETVEEVQQTNDNSGSPAENNELEFSAGQATLSPGQYYLDRLDVEKDATLVLDTQDERITIGVRDYAVLADNAEISILGDGKVEVYIRGEVQAGGSHFELNNNSSIETEGSIENSTNFWVYGHEDMETQIGDPGSEPAYMEGVLYSPTGPTGTSKINIYDADVYGGVVAGSVELHNGQDSAVHFDKALKREQAIPEDTKVVSITYLHVTTNQIDVEAG